jgi:hypothetical protein
MGDIRSIPTTVYNRLVGKVSDGQSVRLTAPGDAAAIGKTNATVVNTEVVWTAKTVGISGNLIKVTLVDPGIANGILACQVNASSDDGVEVEIDLATGALPGKAITSDAADLVAIVAALPAAATLIGGVANGTGLGVVLADSITLAGGTDTLIEAKKFYQIGPFVGMAMNDKPATAGENVILDIELAEYETSQTTIGDVFAVGDPVYFDVGTGLFTTIKGGLTLNGAVTRALSADGVFHFKLTNPLVV